MVDSGYARYVLFLLMIVYFFNYIDRQILSILAEDIKADLGLSDGDLGFLYGSAFAVFYAIFGIPLARLADSWQRKKLIAIGLGFWSLMTALSGTAKGFTSLALYRFGVGVGEASATPAAYSLLYDYFSPKLRTTVLAIYSSGVYIGMGGGLFLGGAILDGWNNAWPGASAPFALQGWQVAFVVVGAPGILLSLFVAKLKEPQRGLGDGLSDSNVNPAATVSPFKILKNELLPMIPIANWYQFRSFSDGPRVIWLNVRFLAALIIVVSLLVYLTGDFLKWSVLAVGFYCVFSWIQSLVHSDTVCFSLIFKCKTILYIFSATAFTVFAHVAIMFWSVPFFQRYYGVDSSEVGRFVGFSMSVGGLIGVLMGGVLADWLSRHSKRGKLLVALGGWTLALLAALALLSVNDVSSAYICSFMFFMFIASAHAPLSSTVNDLMIPRTRAVATALNIMVATFAGFALGPYSVGLISDAFIVSGIDAGEALRKSLQSVLILPLVGLVLLSFGIRHIANDMDDQVNRVRLLGEKI